MPRSNISTAIASTLDRFHNWLRRAQPGDTYTYHTGLLSADRWEAGYDAEGTLKWTPVEPFHTMGLHALAAAEDGLVTLWQRRIGVAEYEYIVRRTHTRA